MWEFPKIARHFWGVPVGVPVTRIAIFLFILGSPYFRKVPCRFPKKPLWLHTVDEGNGAAHRSHAARRSLRLLLHQKHLGSPLGETLNEIPGHTEFAIAAAGTFREGSEQLAYGILSVHVNHSFTKP